MALKAVHNRRALKHGSNAMILTVTVVAIAVVLFGIVERSHLRWDLTSGSQLSLSDQTRSVVGALQEPVTVRAFFGPALDYDTVFIRRKVDDVLKEYTYLSKQIDYQMVDPLKEPEVAMQFGVKQDGTIVFQKGPNRKDVNRSALFDYARGTGQQPPLFVGEQAFTNALLEVSEGKRRTIYLLSGHGEKGPNESKPNGLAILKSSLEGENFEVKELKLAAAEAIPDDCTVLVIAGPTHPVSEREDQLIAEYFKDGGTGVIMVDPVVSPGLEKTAGFLGIQWRGDLILDPARSAFPFAQLPIPEYRSHPIVDPLKSAGLDAVLQEARSLSAGSPAAGFEIKELLATSAEAWGETTLVKNAKFQFDVDKDTKGPLILAYAIGLPKNPDGSVKEGQVGRGKRGEMKAVIFGDSDFAANGLLRNPGNLDLFMNSVEWLTGSAAAISIRPKTPEFHNMSLTPGQARFVRLFTMGGFPLSVLLVGGVIWWRRRKL